MDKEELRRLKPELKAFLDRYVPRFGREENEAHMRRFVQGLLAGEDRRNAENIAESMAGGVVRTVQKFVSQAAWEERDVLDELRCHVAETLADADGIVNADETGFPKKGNKSVGVKRQYSGTLGRVDNCQIGVFLNYCSPAGHALMDRRLFLPEEWAADRKRCAEAGVPEGVIFRTKPHLALEMVQAAVRAELPFRWVGGDTIYGNSPTFVQGVQALQKWYVLDVSSDFPVWLRPPLPAKKSRPSAKRKSPVSEKPLPVAEAMAGLPPSAWKRITVSEGSQGPIVYEYAELVAWFSEEGHPPAAPERLLIRRSLGQKPELKFHRSNAPAEVPLQRVAEVRASRWTIEQDLQAGKGECGLDEYETRGWTGWHHHTALSILALFSLVLQRRRLATQPNKKPRR